MAFIAAPVAAWAIGAGASATVGAIAGAVAVGVVSGAVIGAATALVSGGNILEGALKGAVFGGISGGVMSGLSMAVGFSSAGSQLASVGLSPTGAALTPGAVAGGVAPATTGLPTSAVHDSWSGAIASPAGGGTPGMVTGGGGSIATPGAEAIKSVGTVAPTERGFFDKLLFDKAGDLNPGAGKIIAGGIEGVAKGLLSDDEKPESQSEYLAKVQAMNVSGEFQGRVANIQIPDYWKRYSKAGAQKVPTQNISPQVTVPQITAPQPGGAYA
ncbi:MAG: hypothetical protein GY845_03420 [Planctomycetes bacterium]|nr:hypothetical protein [Planctomycetota bacterium]